MTIPAVRTEPRPSAATTAATTAGAAADPGPDLTFRLVADERTGPRTLVGPGEDCLLCGDAMEAAEVYLFVQILDDGHGIAHESCLQEHTTLSPVAQENNR